MNYHVNISDVIFCKSLFGSVMKKNCLVVKVISSVRENPFNRKRALFLLSQRSSSSGIESHTIWLIESFFLLYRKILFIWQKKSVILVEKTHYYWQRESFLLAERFFSSGRESHFFWLEKNHYYWQRESFLLAEKVIYSS